MSNDQQQRPQEQPGPAMTPAAFTEKMREAAGDGDPEGSHCDMDRLMCELLTSLGYGEGVEIFRKSKKWYA